MVVLIQCQCPQGHRIAGSPVEWPDGLTRDEQHARGQEAVIMMQAAMVGSIVEGRLAPACPQCAAPFQQWTFELYEAKEGVTYADLVKRVAEASYLDVAVIALPHEKPKDTIH